MKTVAGWMLGIAVWLGMTLQVTVLSLLNIAVTALGALNEAVSLYAQAGSVRARRRILDTVEGVIDRLLAAG